MQENPKLTPVVSSPAITPFPCKFCSKSFKYRRAIDSHMAKKHPQETPDDPISDTESEISESAVALFSLENKDAVKDKDIKS